MTHILHTPESLSAGRFVVDAGLFAQLENAVFDKNFDPAHIGRLLSLLPADTCDVLSPLPDSQQPQQPASGHAAAPSAHGTRYYSLLDVAAKDGSAQSLAALCQILDPNARPAGFERCVFLAMARSTDHTRALLGTGRVDINLPWQTKGRNQESELCRPIDFAAQKNLVPVLAELIAMGADLGPGTPHLRTPLMQAAAFGCIESIHLMAPFSDLFAKNSSGHDAVDLARRSPSPRSNDAVQTLEAYRLASIEHQELDAALNAPDPRLAAARRQSAL
jgi:hypothetical protein